MLPGELCPIRASLLCPLRYSVPAAPARSYPAACHADEVALVADATVCRLISCLRFAPFRSQLPSAALVASYFANPYASAFIREKADLKNRTMALRTKDCLWRGHGKLLKWPLTTISKRLVVSRKDISHYVPQCFKHLLFVHLYYQLP